MAEEISKIIEFQVLNKTKEAWHVYVFRLKKVIMFSSSSSDMRK